MVVVFHPIVSRAQVGSTALQAIPFLYPATKVTIASATMEPDSELLVRYRAQLAPTILLAGPTTNHSACHVPQDTTAILLLLLCQQMVTPVASDSIVLLALVLMALLFIAQLAHFATSQVLLVKQTVLIVPKAATVMWVPSLLKIVLPHSIAHLAAFFQPPAQLGFTAILLV